MKLYTKAHLQEIVIKLKLDLDVILTVPVKLKRTEIEKVTA
jgi:hypothetical protein